MDDDDDEENKILEIKETRSPWAKSYGSLNKFSFISYGTSTTRKRKFLLISVQ